MFNNNFGGTYMGSPYYVGFGQPGNNGFDGYPYYAPRMSTDDISNYKKLLSADYFVINCTTIGEASGENIDIGYFCIDRSTNRCYISSLFTLDALHHYSDLSDKMILFKKFVEKYNSDESNSKITSSSMSAVAMRTERKRTPFFDSKPLVPDKSESVSIDDLNKEE